ncbi:MAG TPA: L-threonylcarbamoyladenylate synthase [Gemmataceae bacterium]|nr:L-threonylcarbamoyladenylate synthase [Gemmataceae bacterium]
MNPDRPEPGAIVRAAAVLRAGGLVAFPTETVYGLGANALDSAAVRQIFDAKERPANNPLIVHVADLEAVRVVASEWPLVADPLARRFWPGPLTLVLPRAAAVPDEVTAGGPTVAVRWPAHPVAQALIAAAGVPVAAPSANRSSGVSPTRAEHVLRDLDGRIELILDGGATPGGIESTVLDLTTAPPRLLRPGPIAPGQIEALIGEVSLPSGTASRAPLPSPGMMARHYAPRARVELARDSGWELVRALSNGGRSVGWLAFAPPAEPCPASVKCLEMPSDAVAYARRLYAALREVDESGVDCIVVALPPDAPEWLAVRDRLHRAAAK